MTRRERDLEAIAADLAVVGERWPMACRRMLDGLGGYPSGGDGVASTSAAGSREPRGALTPDPAWRDLCTVVAHVGRLRVLTAAVSGRGIVTAVPGPLGLVARWQVEHAAGQVPGGWVRGAVVRCEGDLRAIRTGTADPTFARHRSEMGRLSCDLRRIVVAWTTTDQREPDEHEREGWCPSCLRVGSRSPSRPGHGRECRWCQDTARNLRATWVLPDGWPPTTLVRQRAEGRRVSERDVAEACRGLARVRRVG